MKQLTVMVDMDDTIEDLLEAWVSYLNDVYGTSVKKDDVAQWDISRSFPMLSKEQVYEPLYCDAFWREVKPIEGASEALRQLIADGHTVLIVTSSAYETIKVKMQEVLFRYFPFLSWDDVIITTHKQLISGDVLVDDGVHNLEGGSYAKILVDSPHNRQYDAEANGMLRLNNWTDIYNAIRDMAEKAGEK